MSVVICNDVWQRGQSDRMVIRLKVRTLSHLRQDEMNSTCSTHVWDVKYTEKINEAKQRICGRPVTDAIIRIKEQWGKILNCALDKLGQVSFLVSKITGRKFLDHLSDYQRFAFCRKAHLSSDTLYCTIIIIIYVMRIHCWGGRDSSVGIATRYGLDGPEGSNPGGGDIFRTRPDRPWGPPNLLYNGYRVFPGGKAAGTWCWPPPPLFSAEVLNRVELYLYIP